MERTDMTDEQCKEAGEAWDDPLNQDIEVSLISFFAYM